MDYDLNYALDTTKKAFTEQYWDVDGRTRRKDFWHFFSIMIVVSIVVGIIGSLLGSILGILGTIVSLASLVFLPAGIGMMVRRMHDIDQPWFMGLIPLYNIYLAAQPGTTGQNQFGADPKATVSV